MVHITDFTISDAIDMAVRYTRSTADLPDYKCRSRILREMRDAARRLMERCGYLIEDGHVFAYGYNVIHNKISIIKIR